MQKDLFFMLFEYILYNKYLKMSRCSAYQKYQLCSNRKIVEDLLCSVTNTEVG